MVRDSPARELDLAQRRTNPWGSKRMSQEIMLDLPENRAQRIRNAAAESQRTFEDVVVEYIQRGAAELLVESLPDADVLALCTGEMAPAEQTELEQLPEKNREGQLQPDERSRFDELMGIYRRGLIRKAQARRGATRPPTAPSVIWPAPLSLSRSSDVSAPRRAIAAATFSARSISSWHGSGSSIPSR